MKYIYHEGEIVNGNRVLSGPFRELPYQRKQGVLYMTECQCGKQRVQQAHAVDKHPQCIPCSKRKHGFTPTGGHHPLYQIWAGMRARCRDEDNGSYGGKGVKVCERWSDFTLFLADMGPRPSGDHSIDRIDGSGDYEPGNCRWATRQLQQRNLKTNRIHYYLGRGWNIDELASHAGLKTVTLSARINALGWPIEKAVETPLQTA